VNHPICKKIRNSNTFYNTTHSKSFVLSSYMLIVNNHTTAYKISAIGWKLMLRNVNHIGIIMGFYVLCTCKRFKNQLMS